MVVGGGGWRLMGSGLSIDFAVAKLAGWKEAHSGIGVGGRLDGMRWWWW